MRIIFLCSSLEPGRDGVGDYTRRLAAECIRQGHECRLISLNERNQTKAEKLKTEMLKSGELKAEIEKVRNRSTGRISAFSISAFQSFQESEGTKVESLRLPGSLGWPERLALARQWVDHFNPDWVSLQYVCYGYHPKGLARRWNLFFAQLGKLANHRHLMFHELWIGPPPLHRRLIGWAQRWVVKDLHRRFEPNATTTSMSSYRQRLSDIGIPAKVLPLFGNIPVVTRDDDHITGLLQAAGSRMAHKPRDTFLNGAFFGTVHPDFEPAPLIQWLGELRSRTGKTILLTIIGRVGIASERLAKQLAGSLTDTVEIITLGGQSEEIISQALQFADFGINTGSPKFLGKSGTFAAMREHGLPIVLRDGELDSTTLQNVIPPVFQFSNRDSVLVAMNYSRVPNAEVGVAHRAADMIRLFEGQTSKRCKKKPLLVVYF